jgi:hypothetical protein
VLLDGVAVSVAGRVVLPPHRRGLALVFQDLALWPNLSARDNVLLGLAGLSLPRRPGIFRDQCGRNVPSFSAAPGVFRTTTAYSRHPGPSSAQFLDAAQAQRLVGPRQGELLRVFRDQCGRNVPSFSAAPGVFRTTTAYSRHPGPSPEDADHVHQGGNLCPRGAASPGRAPAGSRATVP